MIPATCRGDPGGVSGQIRPITPGPRGRGLWSGVFAAVLLIVALLAVPAGPALAQETQDIDIVLDEVTTRAGTVKAELDRGQLTAARIEELRAGLEDRRQVLQDAAEAVRSRLEPLSAELEALGPAPAEGASEADEIAGKRADLESRIAPLDARLKRLQVALTQVVTLADRLVEYRRERFMREILERQPTPLSPDSLSQASESLRYRSATIVREIGARLDDDGTDGLIDRLALPLLLAIAAFALAFWLRRSLITWIRVRVDDEVSPHRRARLTAAVTLVRLILPSVGIGMTVLAVHHSGLLGPNGMIFLTNATIAAAFLIVAYAFGGAFFAPRSRGLRVSGLSDWRASSGYRWYVTLAFVAALDQLLVAAGSELRLTIEALAVLNAGLLIVGGFALWRLVTAVGLGKSSADDQDQDDGSRAALIRGRVARTLLTIVAIVAPLLALAGYFAASRFMFFPVIYSTAVIGAAIVIHLWVVAISTPEPVEKPDQEETDEAAEEAPLSVMPVITGTVLTVLVLPALAVIWGARATDLSNAWSIVVDGFQIGDVTISPMDFVLFAIVFAIGFFITRILKGVLSRSVLPVLKIDAGAKAALLAGVGYVGVIVSALIAISTTGLDLSNLAIVFGALSVGIGFGLQNIVNNFVSGVILLIERPIKVGDWVEIGGINGMVRRINVRSTQIQKFDRSTMFVPNADLISGTVTNWYHGEGQGQLKLPVGVAYGSDVRKVEQILLEAAAAHPMILRTPAPFVLFTDFGASSLDFELRGIMADVNMILTLPSELRYSIYRRFDEEGIEIPYAHRDITIRNAAELRNIGGADD